MYSRVLHYIIAIALFLVAIPFPAPGEGAVADVGQIARSYRHHDFSRGEMPWIAQAELPLQAQEALKLIKAGGPFPYPRDGIVFGNREGRLPSQPRGYYHEYTVITPGRHDRGARRIIHGGEGEFYYTDDHYRTFKRIKEQ